jgi:hypothetical protein
VFTEIHTNVLYFCHGIVDIRQERLENYEQANQLH